MKIKFLGTGACEGVPAPFCSCPVCRNAREKDGREVRRRTSALINDELLIDMAPDFFWQSLHFELDLSLLSALLITHTHYDHFYVRELTNRANSGEFLRGPEKLEIFGSEDAKESLERDIAGAQRDALYAAAKFTILTPFIPHVYGTYTITPLKARHGGETPFVYMLEEGGRRMLYGCDSGFFPEETWDFLRGIYFDLVVFDCTNFTEMGSETHMGLEDNLTAKRRMQQQGCANERTRFHAAHFSHLCGATHYEIDEQMRICGIRPAHDGLEITF